HHVRAGRPQGRRSVLAARPPPGRRLVCPATRVFTHRGRARGRRVGLPATRHGARRARARQLGNDRAHGPAGTARAAAPAGRVVAARWPATRDDRGGRTVPLGVPRRRERGSVSRAGGRVGGLAAGRGSRERGAVCPVTTAIPNGLPVQWRWLAGGEPRDVVVALTSAHGLQQDTLRFDAEGRAELWPAPGQYHYAAAQGPERGLVVVDTYSEEWRPGPVVVAPQAGAAAGRLASVALRDRWWLFVAA